ncbi:hypothetical protein [Anatilimnocola floriformis]|uniref:hypothetical protein n=1 Tax=Anatilimnocola floriformis TaxID=2948575 RepID=UPI0020C347D2|nr:hypothetical protein [Anatilimnocola floriformis]
MNGIALLILAATLGVEYDWQTTDDGQIEYVLIVEPDFIPALSEGSEIRSSVPSELESVQRLCIRIAQPAKGGITPQSQARKLPSEAFRSSRVGLRAAEPVTILWKALGQPEETTLVRYGYQPTKEGQLEYFVQIDPKLLRTLAPGDEIYTTLAAEAGRTDTFVVFSNAKQLPKVPGKPAAAPLPGAPGSNLAGSFPRTNSAAVPAPYSPAPAPFSPPSTFNSPSTSPPAATSTSFGPPASPAFGAAGYNSNHIAPPLSNEKTPAPYTPTPYTPLRSFGATDDLANDYNSSRVNPAAGYGPAQPSPTDNIRGFDTTRTDLPRPNLNAPNTTGYGSSTQPYGNQPGANDLYTNNFGNNQSGNLRPNGSQLPAAGNAPYRPGVGYDNQLPNNQQNGNLPNNHQQNGNFAQNNAGYNNPNQTGYNNSGNIPMNPQAVGYGSTNGDNHVASLPSNSNTLRPGLRDELRAGGMNTLNTVPVPQEKPWWWLVFTAFLLFVSFGANLYLGWTAAEFYSRYRLAVERLRTTGTRG